MHVNHSRMSPGHWINITAVVHIYTLLASTIDIGVASLTTAILVNKFKEIGALQSSRSPLSFRQATFMNATGVLKGCNA